MKDAQPLSGLNNLSKTLKRGIALSTFLLSLLFIPLTVFGQITQVGSATTASNSGTTVTITKPTGIQVGDVMIASIVQDDNSNGTDLDVNITSPGWSSIDGRHLGGTNPEWWGTVLYKVAVASDVTATNYVFTLDNGADGGIGSIVAFRGADVTGGVTESGAAGGPFDVDPGIINGIATDATLSAASITTSTANAAVIMLGLMGDDDNDNVSGWTTTSPGALTELYENENTNGAQQTVAAAWQIKAAAGATGAGSATLANSNNNGALLIALKKFCTPPVVPAIGGGATSVCIGSSTPAFTNATPGGVWSTSNNSIATINAGTGVALGVAAGNVNVIYTVTDANGCTGTAAKALTVTTVPAQPSAISGATGLCPSSMGIPYSVTNVAGVTYTWSVTGAGWSIASGQGTSSITLNAGATFPQTLTVLPNNSCGNGPVQTLVINNSGGTPVYCTQCNTSCSEPTGDNPDLTGSCADLKIALVLDESTSIGATFDQDVEAGFMAFVNTLSCTGVELAVVEFNNQARFVLDTVGGVWYHPVDNVLTTAMQNYATGNGTNPLLNGTQTYAPEVGTNYTNWHSAMLAVDHIPEPPNLVIFFTDGVPTKVYLTNPPPNFGTDGTQCGGTGAPDLAEYENPAKVANKLKCEGVHMFVAGVGDIQANIPIIQEISGSTAYANGINDITNSDYATGDFNELALGLSTFVSELCPFSSDVTTQDICPNGTNGSITITIPSNLFPYNYQYYNNTTNVLLGSGMGINTSPLVISGLAAGSYRIEVQVTVPGSGCTRTEIFFETITAGAVEVVASVTGTTQPTCANPNGGTATLTITAGEAPYMITLKKGGVTQPGYPVMGYMATMYTATGLDAGSYTFELKDVNNCNTDIDAFTLNPPSGCCPVSCNVTGGPGGNVCPNTQSTFAVAAVGGSCTTPAYSWTLTNNTSGASIVGSSTGSSVTVSSGTTCGTYTIQSSLTCSGCSPLICTQVVNVVDVTAPVMTFCPAGSDLGCNPAGVPAPGAATATDACGTPTITSSLGSITSNGCGRSQTRTYTATDACGNTATCAQVFTWTVDVTPPTITLCPAGSDLGCNPAGVPAAGTATATDACGTPTITSSLGSVATNGCGRSQTRTYTATDGCGNTATCAQVFTWTVDVTPPTITLCPAGSDLGCNPAGVPAAGTATATDACGTPTITSSLGSIATNGCGRSQTRTYTATDACGNTATCTQVYTWTVDVTPPTITLCPAGSDLGCNPAGVPAPGAATATDACGTPTITSSLGSIATNGCGRSQTRTYTATDGCGNTSTCTQEFTWTVDVTPPTITLCPAGADLGCNPAGVPAAGTATATDACGTPTITSSLGSITSNGCGRSQTRTYTATDACGNTATCAQVFTWTADVTPPTITLCPAGADLGCNPAGVPAAGTATATDACGTPTITSSLGSIATNGCGRSQTRTYTATDACGNTATCAQVFTWTVDVTPPTITLCPAGSDLGCNPAGVPAPGTVTATDACGTPTITSSLGSITSDGCGRSQTRTYTATDACGNTATCAQLFTWTADVTPPTITLCPAGSDLGCNPADLPAAGTATATDACGTPTITSSLGSITTNGCGRSQTRTYTATDACGNTATCDQVFTWTVDVTPPTITLCPAGSDLGCNPAGVPAPGAATATDACGTPTITSSLGSITTNGCGRSQTRTYTATDACGNTATCAQVFTWTVDVTPPTITLCPAGSDLGCNPAGVPAPGAATATDACGTPTITSSLGSIATNGCGRSQTRTYTATDACGNTATCAQVFTWTVDVTPPTITLCPAGSDLGCNPAGVPAAGTATATDACGTPTITSSLGSITTNGCGRSQTRTYTATDACGNTATCAQEFTWTVDVTPPTITLCPAGSDLGCNPAGVPAPGSVTATDACGVPTITSSLGSIATNGCTRSQTRTYTATDACGNTATCAQVFTWTVDVTPPTITFCPVGSDLGCNPVGVPAPGSATATDACGVPTITSSLGTITTNGCTRSQTRTYTATDGCGNTATCAQVFTWTVDVNPPVFTFCPPGSDLGCNPAGVPVPGAATATDACGAPTITSSLGGITSNGCGRSQTRTYTATDGCGNTSTCTQVFTWIEDTTPPVIIFCPPGADLGCNPAGVPAPITAIATDACGVPTITSSLGGISTNGCLRSQTRTYVATDGCGNTMTCDQLFTWTVDVTPPTFTFCPVGSDLGCNPAGVPAPGAATATDECGVPSITSGLGTITTNGCLRSQTRTYTATDGCGNTATCTQVFTWTVDVTPPVFTFCPPGSELGCNPAGVPAPGAATATDACGAPSITSSLGSITSDGCFRSQTRTYTAIDGCGNTAICTQVFTWTADLTPPVFTLCPLGSDLGCNPAGVPAAGAATATDACGVPTITSALGSISSNGCGRSQTRTYTATDGCGNTATCAQVFTWTVDLNPPVFTFCPPGSNLGCNPATLPAPGAATATDACSTPSIQSVLGPISSDGCFRQQTRTYVATDGCGNTSTCTQVFTWTADTAPPMCIAQNITISIDPAIGYLIITPAQIDNGSTDACGQVMLSIDRDSFTCNDVGVNPVVLTVTDLCGNTSTCTATVTVDQCYEPCVTINGWVYLEGAATDPNGLPNSYTIPMRTDLNDLRILPGQTLEDPFFGNKYTPPGQPYDIAPWNYMGTEGDSFDSGGDPMNGDAGYPGTVVDWVLVSLRADALGTGGPVCQAAALLHQNGYIDFVEPFDCCDLNLADSFYLVVEHRNHLIVMSHEKLPIVPGADSSTIFYNFTEQLSYEDDPFGFGVFSQIEIQPGVFAMFAGNGDQVISGQSDTDINFDDRSFWEGENGDIGEYRIGDYNLNGDTNFNDRLTWERNNGKFTSVPRD